MSTSEGLEQCCSVVWMISSSGLPTALGEDDNAIACLGAQEIKGTADLVGARLGSRIVEGQHEIALHSGNEALCDDGPGLQIVGQRDNTEIMAEGRAQLPAPPPPAWR